MVAEMSGQELQNWQAYFAVKADERRDEELDRRGKQSLARQLGK